MSLSSIVFDREAVTLSILDQLLLPYSTEYVAIDLVDQAFSAIKLMQVRGAPAIAIVGMFAVAVETARASKDPAYAQAHGHPDGISAATVAARIDYLVQSRPTAVNLLNAATELKALLGSSPDIAATVLSYLTTLYDEDLANNHRIGDNGVAYIKSVTSEPSSALTVCNTGALATAGHGTALGIVRSAHAAGVLAHTFALETRPYNQGSRLTAYELVHDKIPATLVTDSMAAFLMERLAAGTGSAPPVRFIFVGADRIAANGDTANKIGTFQLAVLAAARPEVRFVVAAPRTTIDLATPDGSGIVIEERPGLELTTVSGGVVVDGAVVVQNGEAVLGKVGVAAPGVNVWNPAFDVTPALLIDAIVTEEGVYVKHDGKFSLAK